MVVQGRNLRDAKSLEGGYLLQDVVARIGGVKLDLPCFFCSHIDNN